MSRRANRPRLGWCEQVELPGLGLPAIPAKLDTGARVAALHASRIEPFRRGGRDCVEFVLDPFGKDGPSVELEAECVAKRHVRSSNGEQQERHVVLLDLALAGQSWTAEVTLTDRRRMHFPLLLGRETLGDRFLIDPSARWLASNAP